MLLGFLLFRLLVYLQNLRKAEVYFENKIACLSHAAFDLGVGIFFGGFLCGFFFVFLLCIFLLGLRDGGVIDSRL